MVSAGVQNSVPREGGPFSSLARVVGWRDLVDACANDVPLDHDTMHKVWTANFQLTRNFRIRIFSSIRLPPLESGQRNWTAACQPYILYTQDGFES
jgi:hypothetical protein